MVVNTIDIFYILNRNYRGGFWGLPQQQSVKIVSGFPSVSLVFRFLKPRKGIMKEKDYKW